MGTPQIWQVAYPSGARSRVTNDLNAYIGTSLSADGRSLATIQVESTSEIFVANGAGREPLKLTHNSKSDDGTNGIAWLPDGRLVYTSGSSGVPQLWICDGDGNNARQLTSAPGPALNPATSPDGRWIYFTNFNKDGSALFRIEPDGSGLQQLTTDGDARGAIASRDGKTLYYTAMRSGAPQLMRVSAEGGKPEPMGNGYFRVQSISFDGARLLGVSWSDSLRRSVVAIMKIDDRSLQLQPDLPPATFFMPDGSFAEARRSQGKVSIVLQPPAGGPPHAVTPPDARPLLAGAVSPDGRIAFVRGTSTADVVLVKSK
jgi:Tol biopolymer transport system component